MSIARIRRAELGLSLEAQQFILSSLHRQFPEIIPDACLQKWSSCHTEIWLSELTCPRPRRMQRTGRTEGSPALLGCSSQWRAPCLLAGVASMCWRSADDVDTLLALELQMDAPTRRWEVHWILVAGHGWLNIGQRDLDAWPPCREIVRWLPTRKCRASPFRRYCDHWEGSCHDLRA